MDFLLCDWLVPLTPVLFKGQLYKYICTIITHCYEKKLLHVMKKGCNDLNLVGIRSLKKNTFV